MLLGQAYDLARLDVYLVNIGAAEAANIVEIRVVNPLSVEGNVWVGTQSGGLNRIQPRAIALEGATTSWRNELDAEDLDVLGQYRQLNF